MLNRSTPRISTWTHGPEGAAAAVGLMVIAFVVGAAAVALDRVPFDAWFGFLTMILLVALTVPLFSWLGRHDGDPELFRTLCWGMVATVVGIAVRYFVVTVVYNDSADAGVYSGGAERLVALFKEGSFTTVPPGLEGFPPESQRVALVLSGVYLVTGVSRWAGTIVFAWMSFGGRLLMWRALRRAVPEADSRRYLLLLLFFPSFVYWPSSLGKEALMVLALGVVSFGAAQLLSERVTTGSILTFLAGVGGLVFIRPHMGVFAVAALGAASLVGTLAGVGSGARLKSTLVRATALVVLVVAAGVVLSQTAKFLDADGDSGGVSEVLERTSESTSIGGSSFSPPAMNSPTDLPWAAITVFFRPFIWEAGSAGSAIAALEGAVLLGMAVASWRRVVGGLRAMLKRPYLVYVLTFSAAFMMAFSYIGNFGILARQRTIMLALAFVFLAMPPIGRRRGLFLGARSVGDPSTDAPSALVANHAVALQTVSQRRNRDTTGVDEATWVVTEGGSARQVAVPLLFEGGPTRDRPTVSPHPESKRT